MADKRAQLEDHGIADRIKDGRALPPAAHQSCVEEDLQVLGDVWLVPVKRVDKIPDGDFTCFELLKDAQTQGLAESSKPACDKLQHFIGHD